MKSMHALALFISMVATSAQATPVVAPASNVLAATDGIYADADPAALAIHSRPGGKANFRRNLNRVLQENPRDVAALTHRAFFHFVDGDIEEGDRDYARALSYTAPGTDAHRHVLWSWGWSLFEAGQDAQALAKWQDDVAQAAPSRPYWVPYTFAVAHWRLGHRDEAIAWYAAAVRSHGAWATVEGRDERTSHWREPERKALAELFAAWQAKDAAR